jgi:hypothetical protein
VDASVAHRRLTCIAARMSKHVNKAFVVLADIPVENGGWPRRESFVVGCSTREEAEATIKSRYPPEQKVRAFALVLSAIETEKLDLDVGEVRSWSAQPV